MIRTRLYRDGRLAIEGFDPTEISDLVTDPKVTVWMDLTAPTEADLAMIADELQLHELAIEDAVSRRQRPKLDRYESHLFVTAYAVGLDQDSGRLTTSEVGAFVTRQALVTVHGDDGVDLDAVARRWDDADDDERVDVGYLLHGLLDYVVDTHFDAVQALDDRMEELEDLLFEPVPADQQVQRRSFELRKSLVLLRRVALPMREVVNSLMRRDLKVVDDRMAPFYQDVYDHVLRVTEWTESLRDLVSTVLETNLTLQGNRMNSIMKKVTSWAAVIAVPTAITGFYGQNVPYPGYGHWSGFLASTGVIVVLSGLLILSFRRRDWL